MRNNSSVTTGILLTNIGTPAAPTAQAIRHYLKKFLTDRRVIEVPSFIWWPFLYGVILPFRPNQVAKLYQKIWQPEGSPLAIHTRQLAERLQHELQLPVVVGMHYSNPTIAEGLATLQKQQVSRIILLPLFPQYSATTTASSFDLVAEVFKTWRDVPALHFIKHYATHQSYINALTQSVQEAWRVRGHRAQHLLFSFHSIPARYAAAGDPYPLLCQQTAEQVANTLGLTADQWSIAFQSRIGRTKWLTPYTDKVLKNLPKQGITDLQVICPGFAVDCLETMEEIAIRGKEQFIQAGGKTFYYIPALNATAPHVAALADLTKTLMPL